MNQWIALVVSLPTGNATARMRAWRALKAAGAAVLRDGVYLLPEREVCRAILDGVAADVLASGGSALVMGVSPPLGIAFEDWFDRTGDYAELLAEIGRWREAWAAGSGPEAVRQVKKLRKALLALAAIDFFPGEAQRQAEAALTDLESALARSLSPDEPNAVDLVIPRLDPAAYRGRTWATRCSPWVDRLASAWLIRRLIDPDAQIVWLASPSDCPATALGFDFDGAAFSHVGARVTFEVLLAAFGIATPALERLAAVVHFLDVGGVPAPEAGGVESILAGLRDTLADDDRLLAAAATVFDGLLANYEKTGNKP